VFAGVFLFFGIFFSFWTMFLMVQDFHCYTGCFYTGWLFALAVIRLAIVTLAVVTLSVVTLAGCLHWLLLH
jgi:hypothetical protein